VRLASFIFCRKIIINRAEALQMKGPLLLASNHPNSFLDAIILDILFDQPVWSLARGDAFKVPFYRKLLKRLKMLPVYRTSEGVENLETNYQTFEDCKNIFRSKGIVLMFSEGKCVNEWHLRPLKKGTARLAISSWQEDIDVKVLPVGINYSSFNRFGKNIFLNFGEIISASNIDMNNGDGKKNLAFNELLQKQLEQLVFEIQAEDKQLQRGKLVVNQSVYKKVLLAIPAALGYLVNAPLFLATRYFIRNKVADTDHYDSVMAALLLLLYPFYLLILSTAFYFFTSSWWSWLALLVIPFTAWSYVQLKRQLD
jgi:1-acyl-sn-glycerol-3-phosphate acyltransferase